jgi:hypothetical protein
MSHSRHTKPWGGGSPEAERRKNLTISAMFKSLDPPKPAVGRPPKKRRLPPCANPTTPVVVQPHCDATPGEGAPTTGQTLLNEAPLPATPQVATPAPLATGGTAQTVQRKVKSRRTVWGAGDNLVKLTGAVQKWDATVAEDLERPEEHCKRMQRYSLEVSIPFETFRKYACADKNKRRALGKTVGRPQVINDNNSQFVVDVMRRKDRGNDGMNRGSAIDMLHDLQPASKRASLARAFDRHLRPTFKDQLTGIVKAQASTSKRCAITVQQQYRWHRVRARHACLYAPFASLTYFVSPVL